MTILQNRSFISRTVLSLRAREKAPSLLGMEPGRSLWRMALRISSCLRPDSSVVAWSISISDSLLILSLSRYKYISGVVIGMFGCYVLDGEQQSCVNLFADAVQPLRNVRDFLVAQHTLQRQVDALPSVVSAGGAGFPECLTQLCHERLALRFPPYQLFFRDTQSSRRCSAVSL
jgi:hypothetical protein